MEIMVDASAIMAVVADEPRGKTVERLTDGVALVAPEMLCYEIANALSNMVRKKTIVKERILEVYSSFRKIPIRPVGIDMERALEIVRVHTIYAYDACYLEAADRLGVSLLTFDGRMTEVGEKLGLNILGEKNVNG